MVQLQPLAVLPAQSSSDSAAPLSSPTSSSIPSGSSTQPRKRRTSARKKIERVAHERAPGLATMVAGHHQMPRNTTKRYSASEYRHLVPDESRELHDPEYEGIKIVRRPSVSTVSSTETSSEISTHLPAHIAPSYERNNRNASLKLSAPPHDMHSHGLVSPGRLKTDKSKSLSTNRSSEHSGTETRRSMRTFGEGGVTYLAPSITMPATSSDGNLDGNVRIVSSGSYNPVSIHRFCHTR